MTSDLQEAKKLFFYACSPDPLHGISATNGISNCDDKKGQYQILGLGHICASAELSKAFTAHRKTELGYSGNVDVVDDIKIFKNYLRNYTLILIRIKSVFSLCLVNGSSTPDSAPVRARQLIFTLTLSY